MAFCSLGKYYNISTVQSKQKYYLQSMPNSHNFFKEFKKQTDDDDDDYYEH